ncbi:hypothetical protein Nmel_005041, partial [Mimus melanotis]
SLILSQPKPGYRNEISTLGKLLIHLPSIYSHWESCFYPKQDEPGPGGDLSSCSLCPPSSTRGQCWAESGGHSDPAPGWAPGHSRWHRDAGTAAGQEARAHPDFPGNTNQHVKKRNRASPLPVQLPSREPSKENCTSRDPRGFSWEFHTLNILMEKIHLDQ